MAANWIAIEDAIRAWVVTASGLPESAVIFADQNGFRPEGQHIAIRLGAAIPQGAAPEISHSYDEGADAGEEITLSVREIRDLGVSIQVFDGGVSGATSARAIAAKIQTGLGLPSVRAALSEAGLAPYDRGRVEHIPEVLDADFEARAILDVRFYLSDGVSEKTTFIETVKVKDTSTEEEFDIP